MRHHALLYSTIWDDPDWRTLTVDAQHAYIMLISQKKLSMCGAIDYLPERWVTYTAKRSMKALEAAIAELERARFVVIDRAGRELAVRTVVRHDAARGYKSKIGMWNSWTSVSSPLLKAALLDEMPDAMWTDPLAPPPKEAMGHPKAHPKAHPMGHPKGDTEDPSDGPCDGEPQPPTTYHLPCSQIPPSSHNGFGIGDPQAVDNTIVADLDLIPISAALRGIASQRGTA